MNLQLPVTPMQAGMLVVSSEAPASGAYVLQLIGEFAERLDTDLFAHSWKQLASRYEILRVHFKFDSDRGWTQDINDNPLIHINVEDWGKNPVTQQCVIFEEFLAQDRERGFLFGEELPYRIWLIQIRKDLYRVVWTFHHALLDGRSLTLLIKEFLAIYDSGLSSVGLNTESGVSYREYLEWLHQYDVSVSEGFWKQTLLGAEIIHTELKSRARRRVFASDSKLINKKVELSDSKTKELYKAADRYGVTTNTLSVAAWSILLDCYTDGEEVLLGVVRSCRQSLPEQLRSVRGLVINTVPLRIRVDKNLLIPDWLRQIRAKWIELRPHELCSVGEMRRWCTWPIGKSMFSSIHVYDHSDINTLICSNSKSGLKRDFRLIDGRTETALSVSNSGGATFGAVIQADSEIFTPPEIDQLGNRYVSILEQLAAHPEWRLGSIDTLTPLERRRLGKLNEPTISIARSGTILDLFLQQVRSEPTLPALVENDLIVSYQQLYDASRKVVRAMGTVEHNRPVGILVGSQPEFVVAMLASLLAGAGFVPLDPDYPDERIGFMFEDCGARIMITIQENYDQAVRIVNQSGRPGTILTIDFREPLCTEEIKFSSINGESNQNLEQTMPMEELVYIVYTSGTTGQPKGVPITSSNLMPLMLWQQEHFELGTNTRTAQTLSVSFDFGLQEILTTLLFGGSLFCPDKSVLRDPEKYIDFIGCNKINMVYLTPSFLEAMLSIEPDLDNLKVVLLGGERLGWGAVKKLQKSVPSDCKIFNGYGPTEASINCAMYKIEIGNEEKKEIGSSVPIGRPTGLSRLYVLNSDLKQVPVGVPGELFIGGPGVAQCYLNRPNLTKQKFIPDQFLDQPSSSLYRSGDRVVLHSDDNLEFLGRSDNQIKLRGHRVELEEIDAILSQHPQVVSVATTVRETSSGYQQIHAFVVPDSRSIHPDNIRKFAMEHLPKFMVPAKIWLQSAMPLSKSGKVDRNALYPPENVTIDNADKQDLERNIDRAPFEQWFYTPVWRHALQKKQEKQEHPSQKKDSWLIFSDSRCLGQKLLRRLNLQGEIVFEVLFASTFTIPDSSKFEIDSAVPADYEKVFTALADANRKPTRVVFISGEADQFSRIENGADKQFKRLLYLLQAIGKFYRTQALSLGVVTFKLQFVTGKETINPRAALLCGMCKTLPYEMPTVQWTCIDFDDQKQISTDLARHLIADLLQDKSGEFVAYRGGQRYILDFQKIGPVTGNTAAIVRDTGIYLITGGVGAIGIELAEALVQKGALYLALLDMPEEILRKEDETNKRFQRLTDRGGKVLYMGADICDPSQVSSAIRKIRKTFGRINGVIHAAGVAQTEIVRKLSLEKVERIIGPKVWGTEILASELAEDSPDFILLCSSIDAIRGNYGQADYCAANAFQDAFAHYMRGKGQRYISLNWEVWQKVGMAARVEVSSSLQEVWRRELSLGITPPEGRQILTRVLCLDHAQIVISTVDLIPRIGLFSLAVNQSKNGESGHEAIDHLEGSMEDAVLKIFIGVLDDPALNLEDDFFHKGGDSLMAMRVVSRIQDHFGVDLPISSVFEAPTAVSLAVMLRENTRS